MSARPGVALALEVPLTFRGGINVILEELIRDLSDQFAFTLVSPDPPDVTRQYPNLAGHLPWNPAPVSRESSKDLAVALSDRDIQLVHFHLPGTYGFGMKLPGVSPFRFLARAGIPSITSAHSVVGVLHGYCGPSKPLWFKLATLPVAWAGKVSALRLVRAEVAVSQHDAAILRRWFSPWAARKVRVIYHSRLRGAPVDRTKPRKKIILCIGHIAFRKGQHILAQAFAKIAAAHPEWSLHFAGETVEPSCEARIRESVAALGDRVQFLGSRQDALQLMSEAEVFAQPSLQEALGLALQEALYASCACIGTTAGGIPELIQHNINGLLCPPNDVPALAAGLDRLLANPKLRDELGRRGPEWILSKDMTAESMVARHAALYREFLP